MIEKPPLKPVIWVGSSRKDFGAFPDPVKDRMGYALYVAQQGGKHADAKPLKGYAGAGVVEIVRDHRGDTFRTIIQSDWPVSCTCSMPSRRNRRRGAKHPSRKSI